MTHRFFLPLVRCWSVKLSSFSPPLVSPHSFPLSNRFWHVPIDFFASIVMSDHAQIHWICTFIRAGGRQSERVGYVRTTISNIQNVNIIFRCVYCVNTRERTDLFAVAHLLFSIRVHIPTAGVSMQPQPILSLSSHRSTDIILARRSVFTSQQQHLLSAAPFAHSSMRKEREREWEKKAARQE